MLNLLNFVKNHFDTDRISDERFKRFSQDHVSKLYANNGGGEYTAMISPTEGLYDQFVRAMQANAWGLALQQSYTLRVDQIIEQFKRLIQQKEGLIRAHFDIDSFEYQQFFPQGITQYTKASKGNIEIAMEQFILALHNNQATLGAVICQQFADLQAQYATARRAQMEQMNTVIILQTRRHEARQRLGKQIMLNLLQLAQIHFEQNDRFADFYDQSLLEIPAAAEDDVRTGSIPANETQTVESMGINPNSEVRIENTGNVPLQVEIVRDAGDPVTGKHIVQPATTLLLTAAALGAQANMPNVLKVANTHSSGVGDYKLRIL